MSGENQGGEWPPPDQSGNQPGGWGAPPPQPGPEQGWGQPPPGQPGQQWGGQPGGQWQPYPPGGQEIPNYLVWSILTTIFCCQPFGIVSIVFAAQVNAKQAQGDIAGALDSSKKAKTWAIASAVSAGVLYLVFGAIAIVGGIASTTTSGY